jgi:hypothetical protein
MSKGCSFAAAAGVTRSSAVAAKAGGARVVAAPTAKPLPAAPARKLRREWPVQQALLLKEPSHSISIVGPPYDMAEVAEFSKPNLFRPGEGAPSVAGESFQ